MNAKYTVPALVLATVLVLVGTVVYLKFPTEKPSFAIVIPFVASQRSDIELNLRKWYQYIPTTEGTQTDLILYYNHDETDNVAEEFATVVRDYVHESVFNVTVRYARLTAAEDVYPVGPTHMFYKLMADKEIKQKYSHVFIMEPDTTVLRTGWVDAIRNIIQERRSTPFWACGSDNKGTQGGTVRHINGNAIYSTSNDFTEYLEEVKAWRVSAYDTDMFEFLEEDSKIKNKFFDRFYFNDFILNVYKTHYSEKLVRDANPNSYFVHQGGKVGVSTETATYTFDSRGIAQGSTNTTASPTTTLAPVSTTTTTLAPTTRSPAPTPTPTSSRVSSAVSSSPSMILIIASLLIVIFA